MINNESQIDEILMNNDFIYTRNLGWNEVDENGDEVEVMIIVLDANLGYNIFRLGEYCELLDWYLSREEALEYAIDTSRKEISYHEINEMGKD